MSENEELPPAPKPVMEDIPYSDELNMPINKTIKETAERIASVLFDISLIFIIIWTLIFKLSLFVINYFNIM